ncbi:MAG: TraB/GumN family protein [Vicinamibacteraceae bacterium]
MAASGTASAGAAEATDDAGAAAGKGPFLWRVDGRTPIYLFGTIHVPDDRVLALPPSVLKAYGEATALYTEIPMDAGTQMGIMGKVMLPDGTQLSEVIGEPLYNRMTAAAEKTLGADHAGMGAILGPLFQRMKPWAAMSQLSLLEFLPDMMAGKQPLDAMLYSRAQADGKTVGALETPDEQIAVFESFSVKEQTRMLELTLDEIERVKPGARTQTQELIDAYLSGDMAVISHVMDEAMAGDTALMSRFQDIAITRRNTHMTERILALRKQQPATVFFFAVGTAHYAGPTGIVAQLQKAGLKVARVP